MNKEFRIIFLEDFDFVKYKDIEDMLIQEEVCKFVFECFKKSEIVINDRKGFVGDGKIVIVKRILEDEYVVIFYFLYDVVNVSE